MLQLKLKQVEEGIAFGGKKIKKARSQGKKIQITVEKEYSRLLGNIAWAYMQKKDFKSAEEHYRKALSFESDKNKQCNLAVCLMHMNKLAEAKFLLQAMKVSSDNANMDESHHAKSYERATQMLAELESQRVLNPIKETARENESGIARGVADGHLNKMKPCPLPFSDKKMNNGGFTEIPYEKRADFDWRTSHYKLNMGQKEAYSACKRAYESPFCNRNIPKVPLTQPLGYLRSRDQRTGWLTENSRASSCRRLSFESSTGSSFSADWIKIEENSNNRSSGQGYEFIGAVHTRPSDEENLNPGVWKETRETYTREHKKSWADIVEEDDFLQKYSGHPHQESLYCFQTQGSFSVGSMNQEGFNDENLDSNIILETPKPFNQAENLSQKIELIDLGSGYFSQPEKTTFSMKPVRRSLCFDQNHNNLPLSMEYLNFEGQGVVLPEEDSSPPKSVSRRNRLQVFKDITACSLKT
ncbi:hypothetical protein CDL12_29204 [Handroanthus impetiginosus]|uniref:Uncharacterized protein n=1 Tax=Handroanthus impetiginosus TaxID=429701 RepID=A0A2G9FZ36_9LAMI|nr:hypothetical protein CDL12_29204 [Handroanthus impetiginosus]